MFYKKGVAIPVLGTVLIVASIIFFMFLWQAGGTFERAAIQKGGTIISLVNFAESLRKISDENIEIIARRAAYDLGKKGGI